MKATLNYHFELKANSRPETSRNRFHFVSSLMCLITKLNSLNCNKLNNRRGSKTKSNAESHDPTLFYSVHTINPLFREKVFLKCFERINHKESSAIVCNVLVRGEIYCTNCHRMFITLLMCFYLWIYEQQFPSNYIRKHREVHLRFRVVVVRKILKIKLTELKFGSKLLKRRWATEKAINKRNIFTILSYDSETLWRYHCLRSEKRVSLINFPKGYDPKRKVQNRNLVT